MKRRKKRKKEIEYRKEITISGTSIVMHIKQQSKSKEKKSNIKVHHKTQTHTHINDTKKTIDISETTVKREKNK